MAPSGSVDITGHLLQTGPLTSDTNRVRINTYEVTTLSILQPKTQILILHYPNLYIRITLTDTY